jgi:outer membrane protein W
MLKKQFFLKQALKSSMILITFINVLGFSSAQSAEVGQTIVKVRAQLAFLQAKTKYSNTIASTNLTHTGKKLFKAGYGAEVAMNYFFTENIATEISLGLISHKLQTPLNAANSVGTSQTFSQLGLSKKESNKRVYFLPLTALGQYYFAEDEQFSPYVGAGYHYSFAQGSSGIAKFSGTHGPVLQAGFDLWDNDDMSFNLDIKKYWSKKTNVKYKYLIDTATNAPLKGKINYSPILISAGVGFQL